MLCKSFIFQIFDIPQYLIRFYIKKSRFSEACVCEAVMAIDRIVRGTLAGRRQSDIGDGSCQRRIYLQFFFFFDYTYFFMYNAVYNMSCNIEYSNNNNNNNNR
jgi:hypothetical protein